MLSVSEQRAKDKDEASKARQSMKNLAALKNPKRFEVYMKRTGYIWLYLIGNKELNWYKIGISEYPERRVCDLSIMPFEVQLFCAISIAQKDNLSLAKRVEREVHIRYSDKKIRGEWFSSIDPNDFEKVWALVMKQAATSLSNGRQPTLAQRNC